MSIGRSGEQLAFPMSDATPPLEMWGGVEYTHNRVGDRYFDQMELSGHASRPEDYKQFAELGIRTMRVGLLWERHELDPSWKLFDEQLQCLRELGIAPIAGLVHHGSGPSHTSLLDPEFSEKLAAYAGAVAERYPWINAYTPVNEPHTTARFSAMYGVWYPHHNSRRSYIRALVNQMKATVLSMEAIRRVRPDARLIQTDDLGDTCGTETMRPVWEMLNERRWLPFDLLCGHVAQHHPMFAYMQAEGISEAEILWFQDHPCPPSIVGVNYYVTSDRYLDHRVGLYPRNNRSGEGPFVDVEAVRVCEDGIVGVDKILTETWERYRIPVAITEVHIGCTVDEQIRWMAESWERAMKARRAGVQCVSLTAWSLLGSFFWNELVSHDNGHYEPGVFDVQSGRPEPTDLALIIAQIARGERPRHPAIAREGWWHRPNRICFPWEEGIAA